ncbi:hypothetical protein [Segeticoccus rhizosphaerae]|uniref:hypothetical protein n=1 Tax=Segeticoccus rhizosphaerae TaxID=1104777 RepID=UPI0010BF70C2|nr:hypothetical protein [Ornithinicoccus soli]
MSTAIALLIFLASVGAVYFLCVRPMRKAQCAMSGTESGNRRHEDGSDIGRQIADLREEIRILQVDDGVQAPGGRAARADTSPRPGYATTRLAAIQGRGTASYGAHAPRGRHTDARTEWTAKEEDPR